MAVADSWREVRKAELVENTNSRSRFFSTWFGGDMGRNCLGAWASGEVASLQPVSKKRVF